MRNTRIWKEKLYKNFRENYPKNLTPPSPEEIFDVELGLFFLKKYFSQEPASSLWVLLTGYDFDVPAWQNLSEMGKLELGILREILYGFRSPYQWKNQRLSTYRQIERIYRGYEVDEDYKFKQLDPAICPERFDIYEETLQTPLIFKKHNRALKYPNQPGVYYFYQQNDSIPYTVNLPQYLIQPPSQSHNLAGTEKHQGDLMITKTELIATAEWMDNRIQDLGFSANNFAEIIKRIEFEGVAFQEGKLIFSGRTHCIGMMGAGKTTFIKVLAICQAKKGLRTTLVYGDVASCLADDDLLSKILESEGIQVAVVIGSSAEKTHLNRLHGLKTDSLESLLSEHKGFAELSTGCPLDACKSKAEAGVILSSLKQPPCNYLYQTAIDANNNQNDQSQEVDNSQSESRYYCPAFGICPSKQRHINLINAKIWLCTPASLVHTRIPLQLTRNQQIRLAELVAVNSDLVIFDEADRTQALLDATFAPEQTLFGNNRDHLFHYLFRGMGEAVSMSNRNYLSDPTIYEWHKSGNLIQNATDLLCYRLLCESQLKDFLKEREFFTGLILFMILAKELTNAPEEVDDFDVEPELQLRNQVEIEKNPYSSEIVYNAFNLYIDCRDQANLEPLASCKNQKVKHIFQTLWDVRDRLFSSIYEKSAFQKLYDLVLEIRGIPKNFKNQLNEQEADKIDREVKLYVLKLEVALIITEITDHLDKVVLNWNTAATALKLKDGDNYYFNRPPLDFEGLIPAAPMGNQIAFYYNKPQQPKDAGELRFFRYTGIGRWLVLNFHKLMEHNKIQSPKTLLLSGTSWAGTSPVYHLQCPVDLILKPPVKEVNAIGTDSTYIFKPMYRTEKVPVFSPEGKKIKEEIKQVPIKVSGKFGYQRWEALESIVKQFCEKQLSGKTLIEQELDQVLDQNRRRALIFVGSYYEAEFVAKKMREYAPHLEKFIAALERGDGSTWEDNGEYNNWGKPAGVSRAKVEEFVDTGHKILVAPLMAIERGVNILNDENNAAFGLGLFLVRPHPRPDDLTFCISCLNYWGIEKSANFQNQITAKNFIMGQDNLEKIGNLFRHLADQEWQDWTSRNRAFSNLPPDKRKALTWTIMATMLQAIARLIRGGVPARIVFIDAAFAPKSAHNETEAKNTLIIAMREVLADYLEPLGQYSNTEDAKIVRTLYEPFYQALKQVRNINYA